MKHVRRALVVFINILIILIVVIFGIKGLGEEVYPAIADKLFGVEGIYGTSGEQKEIIKKPVHAEGREYCSKCHEEIYRKSDQGKHNFDCQTCHGAASDHPKMRLKVDSSREFCLGCHKATIGRDNETIRVLHNWENHGKDRVCTACHDPHHPWFD